MKLYELVGKYKELEEMEDIDQQTLHDTLESIEGEIEEKANNILSVIANMTGNMQALDAEIKRLQERKKVIKNQQDGLESYLRENMTASGISKLECDLFTITLIKPKPMVIIKHEDELPDEFTDVEVKVKPKKRDILAALKRGMEVPGAEIGESQPGIMIR